MVISGGIVTPPDTRPLEEEKPKVAAATYEDLATWTIADYRAFSCRAFSRFFPEGADPAQYFFALVFEALPFP